MTLRTLNYGNYGILLIMGNAGFCPSTVGQSFHEEFGEFILGVCCIEFQARFNDCMALSLNPKP